MVKMKSIIVIRLVFSSLCPMKIMKVKLVSFLIILAVLFNPINTHERLLHYYGIEDFTWTTDVLFDVTLTSKGQCVLMCARHVTCLTLTFTEGSQRCQGHSQRLGYSNNPVSTLDTFVYQGKN